MDGRTREGEQSGWNANQSRRSGCECVLLDRQQFDQSPMKNLLVICVCLMFARTGALAQQQAAPPPAVEAKVRALEEEERSAVLKGDINALERLWSVNMIVNNPQSAIAPSREAVLQLVREGKIRYSSFGRSIEAMRGDGNLVIVMGAEEVVPAGPGPRAGQVVRRRFTNIWRLEEGTWTMIARHANVIP